MYNSKLETINLSLLSEQTQVNTFLLFNSKGEIIESNHSEISSLQTQTSKILSIIVKMIKELLDVIDLKDLHQFILKSEGGFFILNNLDKDLILCVYSDDYDKRAFLMLKMDEVLKNINFNNNGK